MQLTNKHNLPKSFVDAVGGRQPHPDHIGVTELVDSPHISALRRAHWGQWTEDVTDRVWAILGSAVHYVLEDKQGTRNDLSEERLEYKFGGITLVGRADLWELPGVLTTGDGQPAVDLEGSWPGFRGPYGDGVSPEEVKLAEQCLQSAP